MQSQLENKFGHKFFVVKVSDKSKHAVNDFANVSLLIREFFLFVVLFEVLFKDGVIPIFVDHFCVFF